MEIPFGTVPDTTELEAAARSSAARMMQAIAMEKERREAGDRMVEELVNVTSPPPAVATDNPYNWLQGEKK